jgi:methylase of polypeptide subunit release factors
LHNPSLENALFALGKALQKHHYEFTTITPLSHRTVLDRPPTGALTLRDIFGRNRPFVESDLPQEILGYLQDATALIANGGELRSAVRFSTLATQLFVHSSFPTAQADAVFFGPDTYRFAEAIREGIGSRAAVQSPRILDIGAGSGAGGVHVAQLLKGQTPHIVLTDINLRALQFSRVNARLNDVPDVTVFRSDLYANVSGTFDLIISNPPYLVDPGARTYRHGGGAYGEELSVRIAAEGIPFLAPGGCLLLYTGTAVVDGIDVFKVRLHAKLGTSARITYREIDPDVFGEELRQPPYDRADRIAVVAAMIEKE